ncbi:Na-translocating system protein MpsC family protein [Alkalihalobacterium elongatum]|uniref:Na-translocating system protein MpsC family protein n=1 Tax=Alkalihalobacterium elongatum TaxID=2675466 RepID=UPI001F3BC034|nr:Na-translocating system protein MpsC family protein [Alkalihalobacterium elongatum]
MEQETLNSISSYLSKLLRKNFGKGPQSCQSTVSGSIFTTYIRGFISPMEEILMERGHNEQVDMARNVIINHVVDQLKGVVEISLSCEILQWYHDWNFPNNSGLIFFLLDREVSNPVNVPYATDLKKLEDEVARISALVQKVPDKIHIYPVSETAIIVERKGILIPIEKALIAKGFEEELVMTKDDLEKSYFHNYGKFNEIFKREVKEIFIDWNFKEDKSLMGFILEG